MNIWILLLIFHYGYGTPIASIPMESKDACKAALENGQFIKQKTRLSLVEAYCVNNQTGEIVWSDTKVK